MATLKNKVVSNFGETISATSDDENSRNLRNYDLIRIFLRNWKSSVSGPSNMAEVPYGDEDRLICVAPLTKSFSWSVSPKYTTFGNVVKNMGISDATGKKLRSIGDYSAMTRRETFTGNIEGAKLFEGVSEMSWQFDFRMIEGLDREGRLPSDAEAEKKNQGLSLLPFFVFSKYTTPKMNSKTLDYIMDIFNTMDKEHNKIVSIVKNTANLAQTTIESVLTGLDDLTNAIWTDRPADAVASEYPSDEFALRTRNTIDIAVSNLGVMRNMIITNFSATFSREVLENGLPVYTDYNLKVAPIVQPTEQEIQNRYMNNVFNVLGQNYRDQSFYDGIRAPTAPGGEK